MRKLIGLPVLLAIALAAACAPVTDEGGGTNGDGTSNGGDGGAGSEPAEREIQMGEPADPDEIEPGGTLVIALNAEPDTLDPTLSRSLVARQVFHAMCEKLYDVDADATLVPQLATDLPTISEDGLTVTIPVRADAVFADGTPFDADAVAQSLERHRDLDTSARRTELGPVERVEAPDPETVVIELSEPFAPLTAALADRAGMVMSPQALDELGEDFGSAPVCVGPYTVTERVAQNSVEMAADPHYYDADRVFLDAISYRIITDGSIRAANLQSGDAHVADTVSTQDVPTLDDANDITVLTSESLGYQGVTFNIGNVDGVGAEAQPREEAHAQDARVRQAFSHAVDRQALVDTVFGGLFTAACSPISPASEFSTDLAQECPEYDPDRANALLEEAGVEPPYQMEMLVTNTPDARRLAQALQAMVQAGGFELELTPMEFSALLDRQDNGDFELVQIGWSGRIDPDGNINNFVGTGASQNVAGYSNPEIDDLLDEARTVQEPGERTELYGQVAAGLGEDAPLVYLYRQTNLTGVTDDVLGVQTFPDGILRVAFAGFAK